MKNFWKTPKSISALDCMPARLFMKASSIGSTDRKTFSTRPVSALRLHVSSGTVPCCQAADLVWVRGIIQESNSDADTWQNGDDDGIGEGDLQQLLEGRDLGEQLHIHQRLHCSDGDQLQPGATALSTDGSYAREVGVMHALKCFMIKYASAFKAGKSLMAL